MPNKNVSGRLQTDFGHASVTIGAAAVQLSTNAEPLQEGLAIKADASNTAVIYVGNSSSVTAASGTLSTAAATDGWPLSAGQELFVPTNFADFVYAISTAAGQRVFIMRL